MTKKKVAVKKVADGKKSMKLVEKKPKEQYIMIDRDYGLMKFNSEEKLKQFILETVVKKDKIKLETFLSDEPVFLKGTLLNLNIETTISITEK